MTMVGTKEKRIWCVFCRSSTSGIQSKQRPTANANFRKLGLCMIRAATDSNQELERTRAKLHACYV